ncbi:hemolysin family protein [Tessaracoccus flavus]|uniref:Uncharacterized protein n=1 Tax=Tessaracoccus flavus TaxID=1610493 RepID=A0A1Q2CGX7_9ACTN|nr:hemolysin family protein [Tessaracoccus flavus]AQP45357.1 hypothetical protein RPIT_11575 [Tessaracoccus flavus]SDY94195.1 Hemolysin, contains CBS domains [Tessaracoccus flavus]
MTPVVSLLVGIVVVLGITAATGYFVAQEFAYMAVDRSQLGSRAKAGDKKASNTLEITRRTSFMLSGAQLGITVTGLLVGYVAEPLIGQAIGSLISGGALTAVSVAIGGFIAIALSTIIQMLFGELFPKNYAIARSARVADALTPSTRLYLKLFGPLIWVFDRSAELLLRALKIEPVHDVESAASADDLERVVAASRDSGTLSPELAAIVDRVIDFPRRDAEHAMVPRVQVDVVHDDTPIGEVRTLMATGHTRYPVLDERGDAIGLVQMVDVLDRPVNDPAPVSAIMRDAVRVSEFTDLPTTEQLLRQSGQELACVVDEFGSFVGIVTLEDLAEEIVGELTDEHDPDDPGYLPQEGDGIWVMPGDVHVDEVERAIGLKLPQGDYETIAGLVIHAVGDLPDVGAVIDLTLEPNVAQLALDDDAPSRHVEIEVLAVERHVPSRVRVSLPEGDNA